MRKKPRSFAAAALESREEADRAFAVLEDLAREGMVQLDDAAIVVKTSAGKVELHQRRELSAGSGVVAGGVAGVLAGLLLGLPVAATLVGMAAGGGLTFLDTGIDDSRMKRLGAALRPGQAALCVLVADADWAVLRERMAPFARELLAVELTPEAEAALEQREGKE
jgi:uncharacterized membrane protein